MTAIAGICFLDGRSVLRSDLERMLTELAHCGSHGIGFWSDSSVGLAQGTLWNNCQSLDEKAPSLNQFKHLVLTADARIDNRDELIGILGLPPHAEIGDGDLILRAYERWGEQCSGRLLGDFSFALWDSERQVLLCARDPFGVKPYYYYYRQNQVFCFASKIKALLCLPQVPRVLNEFQLAEYLEPALEGYDKTKTFYQGIFRLAPGHNMTVTRTQITVRPFWSLDPTYELRLKSDEEYVEAFREVFTEAVRCRLRSPSAVGVMLSGGLDSASVTGVADRILAQGGGSRRLHTFSATAEDGVRCPESPFVSALLRDKQIEHHAVRADQVAPFLVDLERVMRSADEPFDGNRHFTSRILYRTAQEQGVRTVLDGVDGDITLSHCNEYPAYMLRAGNWRSLLREVRGLAKRNKQSAWIALRSHVVRNLSPRLVVNLWDWLHGRPWPAWADIEVFNPEFARRIGLAERLKMLDQEYFAMVSSAREDQWRTLSWGHVPFSMGSYDRAASLFSIEPRHPFLDRRVVDFGLALPMEQKVYQGWSKLILRRAMVGILPEKLCWRTDKPNLHRNFVRAIAILERPLLDKAIWSDLESVGEYLDVPYVRDVYQRFLSGGEYRDLAVLWSVANLVVWLQHSGLTT